MFSNVAFSVLAFILALGILVAIHEFGHFWVARKVGIKVQRFSVGFGKSLFTRRGKVDDTEFVLAAIPLGGYVKMLDERVEPVARHERHRAFNNQPLWARSAVVVAGPLANFLLAIVAYWLVFMMGISGVAPLIGAPVPGSLADSAGFQFEDRIVSVDGQETPTWSDASIALIESSLGVEAPLPIVVETIDGEREVRQLAITQDAMLKSDGNAIADLGFTTWWPDVDALIGEVVADGAAAAAGIQVDDLIVAIDDTPIDNWQGLVNIVRVSPDKALNLTIERDGVLEELTLTPSPVEVAGETIGRIGVIETRSAEIADKANVTVRHGPLESFTRAIGRTWDMSALTLRMLGKLFVGQASLDNISGPISIAQYAGQSASIGLDHYINFIALISISLAVLNLLPVPILDGGHLVFFAAEAIRGKPLSERVHLLGQQLGMVMIGGLMFLAFYNDIWRLMR